MNYFLHLSLRFIIHRLMAIRINDHKEPKMYYLESSFHSFWLLPLTHLLKYCISHHFMFYWLNCALKNQVFVVYICKKYLLCKLYVVTLLNQTVIALNLENNLVC